MVVIQKHGSFFKIEAQKNYLRSTMFHERLNGLAMISIEQDMVEKLDWCKKKNEVDG